MATIYRNKQLMYLSAVLFFYFASIGCIAPFLTTHMRQLGFSLTEISFINAVSAFFSLIGPVVGGTFAERQNRYKTTTALCALVGAAAFVGLSFVPRYQKLDYRPLVDFDCEAGLRVERCVNWASCGEALGWTQNATRVRLSDCHYQCPSSGHFSSPYPLHICFHGDHGNTCAVYNNNSDLYNIAEFESLLREWPYVEATNATPGGLPEEDVPRAHVAMCNFLPSAPIVFAQKTYHGITCRPSREGCSIHCRVGFASGGDPPPCEEASGNPTTTFWSYLILRSIGDVSLLTTICLLDAVTIWSTVDYEGAYGRIHVWAALGVATLAPLSGSLFDFYADFSPSSYLAAVLCVFTCALMVATPLNRQNPTTFQQATPSKFLSGETIVLLIVVVILGMQWSILDTFQPWINTDIGCTSLQTGLGWTLAFGFSVPFLLISKNMVRNIGKCNLLVFAFLFYFTRYGGVTFISSPWWTLPFALMGTFTLCVMWIAAVAYGQALAPTGYGLIVQYLLNMLHFGVGRGIGILLGGSLISNYTEKVAFCGIAAFSAVAALFYLTAYHLGMRKPKKSYPALLNGSWYPMRERYPNGDAKAHQPIVGDQDDDVTETSPRSRQLNAK